MGVKGDNLGINSGILLASFILNYMVKRVLIRKNRKNKEKRGERTREGEVKRKAKALRSSLLDHDSSVEVGYGLCYFIVNSK